MECKCGKPMDLIIQEIQDTGYGYYCRDCGRVLVTEMVFHYSENVLVDHTEEEKEWFERNEK